MRKLPLILVLLLLSNNLFAQATFPLTDKRIVTELWCDLMANKLNADAKYWQKLTMETPVKQAKRSTSRADAVISRISTESTVYKNLCEGSVYLLIKETLSKLMPVIKK